MGLPCIYDIGLQLCLLCSCQALSLWHGEVFRHSQQMKSVESMHFMVLQRACISCTGSSYINIYKYIYFFFFSFLMVSCSKYYQQVNNTEGSLQRPQRRQKLNMLLNPQAGPADKPKYQDSKVDSVWKNTPTKAKGVCANRSTQIAVELQCRDKLSLGSHHICPKIHARKCRSCIRLEFQLAMVVLHKYGTKNDLKNSISLNVVSCPIKLMHD